MPDYYLYATLPENDANQLGKIIYNTTHLTPISPKGLLYELRARGPHFAYFPTIDNLFTYLNGGTNQTATILNCLMDLNNCLGNFITQEFPTNQIVALTGLMYVTNGKSPATLQQSIDYMLKTNGELTPIRDLAAMEVIVEYSNPMTGDIAEQIATQNKLLAIGAIFHGNANAADLDVHLSFRQEQRLRAANPNADIQLVGGPVRGIPIDDFEKTFKGFSSVTVVPSMNPNKAIDDSVLFGTPNADALVGSVVYGGDGADKLSADFMAGNAGDDQYVYDVDDSVPVGIDDSDHRGSITRGGKPFSGFVVDNQFFNGQNYAVQSRLEADKTTTLMFTPNEKNSPSLSVFDYQPADFKILPNTNSNFLAENTYFLKSAISPQGRVGFIEIWNGDEDGKFQNFHVYKDNVLENKIKLLPNDDEYLSGPDVAATSDGNFHVVGSISSINAQSKCELTYIKVDLITGTFTSKVIDKLAPADCAQITSDAFLEKKFTATNTSNKELAVAYLKLGNIIKESYGLYIYTAAQGIKKIADNVSGYIDNKFVETLLITGPTKTGFVVASNPLAFTEHVFGLPNQVYEFTDTLVSIRNYTFTLNETIYGISPVKDDYLILHTATKQRFGQPDVQLCTSLSSNGKLSDPLVLGGRGSGLLLSLNDDKTLMLGDDDEIHYGTACVISPDNTIEMKSFTPKFIYEAVSKLPNADAYVLYRGPFSNLADLSVITFPTSMLSKQPQSKFVAQQPIAQQPLQTVTRALLAVDNAPQPQTSSASSLREQSFVLQSLFAFKGLWNVNLNQLSQMFAPTAESTKSTNIQNEPFSFDAVKNDIEPDFQTGEPIHTVRFFNKGAQVASMKLYGQPLICFDESGQRHNILETTGQLKNIDISMNQTEICRVLPPTVLERVSYEAVKQGSNLVTGVAISSSEPAMRGLLNGVGLDRQASANIADTFSTNLLLSYGSVAGIAGKYATPYVQKVFAVSPSVARDGVTMAAGVIEAIVTGEWSPVATAGTQVVANRISSRIQPAVEETFRRTGAMMKGIVSAASRFTFWASVTQPAVDVSNKSLTVSNLRI